MKNIGITLLLVVLIMGGVLISCGPKVAQVSVHSIDDSSPDNLLLSAEFMPVPGFTWSFAIDEPSYLIVFGHVDTEHRGKETGIEDIADKAVMVAFQLKLNGSWLPGSKTGENILNRTDHYYSAQIHGFKELEPGDYTIELHGRSASTAAPGVDGLAKVKATYEQVVYRIVPIK
jgi:hypothetical protein